MRRGRRILKIIAVVLAVLLALVGVGAAVSALGNAANLKKARSFAPVEYAAQLQPGTDALGNVCFTADREFRILQLTDLHIGGGWMSLKKDALVLNAAAAMITAEKPDLVIVTGDLAYPVPFQSGTLNNLAPAKLFSALMEQLGVYWTICFGNHDTEVYSLYSRARLSRYYAEEAGPHCLFRPGPAEIDGFGNQIVSLFSGAGQLTQTLYLFDSHAYQRGDPLGVRWRYDNIHGNQIDWYAENVRRYQALYESSGGAGTLRSLAFFHIPLLEYREAWFEYLDRGDTENVTYYYGTAKNSRRVVYCGKGDDELFETALALGSTQGMFCGHDHYNGFSLDYKGIRLTYGRSLDYLAMPGIAKLGAQRGCTVIETAPDGAFTCRSENYYQPKYASLYPKEEVTMQEIETGKGIYEKE